MRPPQEHIDIALAIENNLREEDKSLYLEWLNGIPMSTRVANPDDNFRNIRDGCILTGAYINSQHNKVAQA